MVKQDQILLLDSSIRDWVLFPILAVMILVGLMRHYVTQLITNTPKQQPAEVIRQQAILVRATTLRGNIALLQPSSIRSRIDWLIDVLDKGEYIKQEEEKKSTDQDEMPKNPLSDPAQMDQMMEMAKKSMVTMVPQTVIMGWVNYFFTGFVLLRLPFPLTLRFKLMLQRGIDTSDMDVTWVSSISWYFLCLFGLNAIFRLILGDQNSADGTRDMAAMSTLGTGSTIGGGASPMGPQQPDYKKLHAQEKESLELAASDTKSFWVGNDIENRILKLYK